MKDPIQEQLVNARRNQILDAASQVFAEKGFHPTTIKDIAKRAGLADGTIYNYFDSKTGLLLGIFDRMRASIEAQTPAINPGEADLRAALTAYLRHPLNALKGDNFELFRVVMSELMVNPEMRTLYQQQILEPMLMGAEAQFQQWMPVPTQQLRLTVRAISGLIMGVMLEHIMGDQALIENWDTLPEFLADLLLNGIGGRSS